MIYKYVWKRERAGGARTRDLWVWTPAPFPYPTVLYPLCHNIIYKFNKTLQVGVG